MSDEIDALRKLIFETATEAITKSEKIRELIVKLQAEGYFVQVDVAAAVRCKSVDWEAADKLACKRRTCPRCTMAEAPFYMRGRVIRERVSNEGDHEIISGPQVRFTCTLCGYGEVIQLGGQE